MEKLYEPTSINPLAYFQYLIELGGLQDRIRRFIGNAEEYGSLIDYKRIACTYEGIDKLTSEKVHLKVTLESEISFEIKQNINKAKLLFNYHAHSLNFPEQSIYVNKNIDNLSVLISTCGKEEVYGVIEIIPEQLKEFYSWMEEWKAKYNLRIPEENIGQASKKALMNENKDDFSELESNCEVKIAKIKERLSHLNGKNEYNKSFLSGHDYEELVKLTVELVCNNSFHTPHNTFDLDGISVRSITYTYYLIMRDNEPQHKVNDKYIDFLHEVFHNKFANTEKETTKKKLSSRPKRYPF